MTTESAAEWDAVLRAIATKASELNTNRIGVIDIHQTDGTTKRLERAADVGAGERAYHVSIRGGSVSYGFVPEPVTSTLLAPADGNDDRRAGREAAERRNRGLPPAPRMSVEPAVAPSPAPAQGPSSELGAELARHGVTAEDHRAYRAHVDAQAAAHAAPLASLYSSFAAHVASENAKPQYIPGLLRLGPNGLEPVVKGGAK